jgi:hypothetical protein
MYAQKVGLENKFKNSKTAMSHKNLKGKICHKSAKNLVAQKRRNS